MQSIRYFFFKPFVPALISGFTFLLAGCSKESTTSTSVTGNWARKSEFEGVGRTEAVSFTINNTAYIGGGYDGTERRRDFWAFDESTGTWTRIADFPGTPRNSAIAFTINGKAYVGTGIDADNNKLNDFWEYDPSANTWTQKADFAGSARYNAVGFGINNLGFVCSGYDGSYLKDLWEYDPSANTWTQKASLGGSKRSEAMAFVYNGIAYVVGGLNNGSFLNDFWSYDPATNQWTEKRKITSVSDDSYDDSYASNITRSNGVAFVMSDKAFLSCGNRSGVIGTTWAYDFSDDTWAAKTNFEGTAREGAVAFTINDHGYLSTGSNSSYKFDDLWEFFPDEEVNTNDN